jgi:hypothetical protein
MRCISTEEGVRAARLGLNFFRQKLQRLFEIGAWCATRSKKLIERTRLAAAMFSLSLLGQAAQLFRVARQFSFHAASS